MDRTSFSMVWTLLLLCLFVEGAMCKSIVGRQFGRKLTRALAPESAPEADFDIIYDCDFTGPFPYMASLRDSQGDFRCGAVLIENYTVITAASCVQDPNGNSIEITEVFLGGIDREDPIERRPVCKVVVHPDYTGDVKQGPDLALVKFSEGTCLMPIPNLGRQTAPGEQYLILGYGRTGVTEPLSGELQGANVTNLGSYVCNKARRLTPPINSQQICTETERCNCASVCEGDEGGPLVLIETLLEFEDTLMGIMSYSSAPCDQEGSLGIHTAIQPHLNWIQRTMQSQEYRDC